MSSSHKRQKIENRERIMFFGPAIVLTIIGFVIAFQFIQPAPQNCHRHRLAHGRLLSFRHGLQGHLEKNGITLDVKSTAGSAENIRLLEARDNGADVAFIQGGTGTLAKGKEIVSLGEETRDTPRIF